MRTVVKRRAVNFDCWPPILKPGDMVMPLTVVEKAVIMKEGIQVYHKSWYGILS